MSSSADYRKATNSAYNVLIKHYFFSPETDVFAIAHKIDNCALHSYSELERWGFPIESQNDSMKYGFTIKASGKRLIAFNDQLPLPCVRFTIAHEIGHVILEHREVSASELEYENNEREANCFARNLLCPLPAADYYKIFTVEDYVSFFKVSTEMAKVTIEHREEQSRDRRNSDRYYLSKALYDELYTWIDNIEHEWGPEFEEYYNSRNYEDIRIAYD